MITSFCSQETKFFYEIIIAKEKQCQRFLFTLLSGIETAKHLFIVSIATTDWLTPQKQQWGLLETTFTVIYSNFKRLCSQADVFEV